VADSEEGHQPRGEVSGVFLSDPMSGGRDVPSDVCGVSDDLVVDHPVDLKLEIQVIPVPDADRSKAFYERLGWRLDDDVAPMDGLRIIQFTPPGSGTSITFGHGLTTAAPGSAEAGLTVSDIQAAHAELVSRAIDVSDIWHSPPFPVQPRQPGPDPERARHGSFFSFTDPDHNTWLVQEVTTRLPGRMTTTETGYVSTADLESALQRAEAAHRAHEKHTGKAHLFHRSDQDKNWLAWDAAYMTAEQAGTDLPT
jgi:catechol 2,3-dioxygenase-like lactoylglutathione lyase family enzyme